MKFIDRYIQQQERVLEGECRAERPTAGEPRSNVPRRLQARGLCLIDLHRPQIGDRPRYSGVYSDYYFIKYLLIIINPVTRYIQVPVSEKQFASSCSVQ
jgi:hypothetical protein